LNPVEN